MGSFTSRNRLVNSGAFEDCCCGKRWGKKTFTPFVKVNTSSYKGYRKPLKRNSSSAQEKEGLAKGQDKQNNYMGAIT